MNAFLGYLLIIWFACEIIYRAQTMRRIRRLERLLQQHREEGLGDP